jgi:transcriptional regulator with GAF, ATPase, and Fis domain
VSTDYAVAIGETQTLNAKLRDGNHRLHSFLNALQGLVTALDVQTEDDHVMSLLSECLDALLHAINAEFGSLLALDEDNRELVYVLVSGTQNDTGMLWQRVSANKGISGWVLQHVDAAIINDPSADDRVDEKTDIPEGITAETLMCIPVLGKDEVLGVITLFNKRVDGMFTDDDQTLGWLMGRFAGELLYRMSK